MADIQNIAITSTQTEPQPKPHISYTIQVSTPTRTWTVNRRYNDFVALHAELKSSTGKEPPAPLPAKGWGLVRTMNDDKKVRERRVQLELYLRAVLSAKNPCWREAFGWADFLAYPTSKSAQSSAAAKHWTPSSWLAEHGALASALRGTRAALLKRDALAGMGDAGGARSASAEAKRQLRDLGAKVAELEKGLDATKAALGEGERRRREEMVEAARSEYASLLRTADAGVRTQQRASQAGGMSMPGGGAGLWAPAGGGGASKASGAAGAETAETRPLDDRGLLQLQQQQMGNQDAQLGELSRLLRIQRRMGEEIAQEVGEQNEMLDDLDHRVDRTGAKMGRAKRELNRLG